MTLENFDWRTFLKTLLFKVGTALLSRKFWAAVFGVVAVFQQLSAGSIEPETAVWAIVTIVATYGGFVAVEDGLSANARASLSGTGKSLL